MERKIELARTLLDGFDKQFCQTNSDLLPSPLRDPIQTLKKELRWLKMFMCYCEKLSHVFKDDFPSAIKAKEAVDCLAGMLDNDEESKAEEVVNQDDQHSALEACEMFLKKLQPLKPVLKEAFLDLSDLILESKYFSRDDFNELLRIALQNLDDLLVLEAEMIAPMKKQIGAVEKRLDFVSAIFHFASRGQHVDILNSFFNHHKDWAHNTVATTFLYLVDEIDERVNTEVSHLIERFKPCTLQLAELYIGALKALEPFPEPFLTLKRIAVARFLEIVLGDLLLPTDDGFEMLEHGLIFFVSFLVNPPRKYALKGNLISTQQNLCVHEAASLICSLYASSSNDDTVKRDNLLHDLVEKVNQAKVEIGGLQLKMPASSWNNFPRTNVQDFLDLFVEDLKEKLKHQFMTKYQRRQVMTIQELLLSLKPSLMGVFERQDENEELKDLHTRISRMAYRADYVIDSCFPFDPLDYWHNAMGLADIIEEIDQFTKIEPRPALLCKTQVHGDKLNFGGALFPQAKNTTMDDVVMVGFIGEKENIINCLTGGFPHRDIVAIVGMAGQGKTTLARKVYHEPRVRLRFHRYAWCCISQAYKIEDILISILKDVNPTLDKDNISCKSYHDLAEMLYRCLKGNTYLIVLDDIWDIQAWNELKESFPDDQNGSRIMFTSRIHKVALEAKCDCSLHELHPLSLEDSLELLRQKLSYKDGFPLNLLDLGKKIAESCKGLPLAIITIAGLLAKADGNVVFWEQIAESLKSQFANEGCMDILELSYKHLPDYLKACFLYLAAFQEDETIDAKSLTRYWIAERLVWKHENQSLEDVANDCLKDLVDRSLLFVAKRSSRFGIKKCFVHDLVREFCLEKAKEENFFLVPNISDDHSSIDKMLQSYRLCCRRIHLLPFQIETTVSTVRTLFFSVGMGYHNASFFFIRFKFLRVLNLGHLWIDFDIEAIMNLVHLRYLALHGAFEVPSSIVNLSRLEFLLLRIVLYSSSVPKSIWNMKSLRHLYLHKGIFEGDDFVNDSLQLDNLETFSSYYSTYTTEKEFKSQLRRMPNVRKLRVRLQFPIWLPSLANFLSKLESLYLEVSKKVSAAEFDLPSTLRKLTMDGPTLSASIVSAIGKLPNLEVLKLVRAHFEEARWDMEDEEFLNLKYLKLRSSNIEEWNVSEEAFPRLQQLILKHCNDLTEIPTIFGQLPTLKVIKVFWCKKLANSVDEIVEEQRGLGNEDLQVTTEFSSEDIFVHSSSCEGNQVAE